MLLVLIRFLGTHNAESLKTRLVSLLIDGILVVDAGSLTSELTFAEQSKIRAILLSHGHYDHIRAIPAFAFNNVTRVTRIFSIQQVLDLLSSHLIDGSIYPDFTKDTSFLGRATLQLVPLEPYKTKEIEGFKIMAIPVNHSEPAIGFQIASKNGSRIFYTGDTGPGLSEVWKRVDPQLLIIDVTMPNKLEKAAIDSGHLCPRMLKSELTDFRLIKGYLPEVVLSHLSPQFELEISEEIKKVAKDLDAIIKIPHEGETITI